MWPRLAAVVVGEGGAEGAWLRVVIALHVMLMQVHCQKHTAREIYFRLARTHTHTKNMLDMCIRNSEGYLQCLSET